MNLLHCNYINQDHHGKLHTIAAKNMDAVARRVVLPQRSHVPLDQPEREDPTIDPFTNLMLQRQSSIDISRNVPAYSPKAILGIDVVYKKILHERPSFRYVFADIAEPEEMLEEHGRRPLSWSVMGTGVTPNLDRTCAGIYRLTLMSKIFGPIRKHSPSRERHASIIDAK